MTVIGWHVGRDLVWLVADGRSGVGGGDRLLV